MESPDGKVGRFTYLLEPIRDLSKSWDVDITQVLTAYLSELERLQITFDGGVTTMNFAEAALLIQGTASVYSKKVERLYQLVLELIPVLSSNRQQKDPVRISLATEDEAAQEAVAESTDRHVVDDDFLPLDEIREGKNIDLREDFDDQPTPSGVKNLTRMPMAMVPLEEFEKSDVPLITRSGEVVGKKDDFKMNTGHIHNSGALLLDMLNVQFLDGLADLTVNTRPQGTPVKLAAGQPQNFSPDAGDIPDDHSEYPAPETSQVEDMLTDPPAGPETDVPMEVESQRPSEPEFVEPQRRADRLGSVAPVPIAASVVNPVATAVDPYKQLDPHEATPHLEKPFKKGKTHRIPAELKKCMQKPEGKKRKTMDDDGGGAFSSPADAEESSDAFSLFMDQEFFTRRAKYPKNPPKILLLYPEVEDLYYEEFKRRSAMKKTLLKSRGLDTPASVADTDSQDGLDPLQPIPEAEEIEDCGDFGGEPDDNDPEVGDAELMDFGPTAPISAEIPVVQNYDDFVRQNMEKFTANIQLDSEALAEIGRRVQEWEEKITPILRAEEKHKPFDIHRYETEVLECFDGSCEQELLFRDLMRGKSQVDICRLFLSTLMLANGGNVEICDPMPRDAIVPGVNTLRLKFLSAERHHDQLQDYVAPSTQTFRKRNSPGSSRSQ